MFQTLQVWLSDPINVTMAATAVVALAILANVWVACRLAVAARRSADAAKAVAQVTRAAFDIAHRPYCAIFQVELENVGTTSDARITILAKNYGSAPLRLTQCDIRVIYADPNNRDNPPSAKEVLPTGSGVVLPQELATFHCYLTKAWLTKIITPGDEELTVIADFDYVALAGGAEYRSESKHRYNPQLGIFETIHSNMN